MLKSLHDERLIQFLMGLNDTYASIRSKILMISPLPNVNVAYSLLIQEEKQRKVYGNPTSLLIPPPTYLAAHQYASGSRPPGHEYKGKKNNLVCSYCKKLGHSVDKCYRIVGFHADFKFTKNQNQKFQVGIKSNAVLGTPNAQHTVFMEGNENPFTPEQTSHLLHLIKLDQLENATLSISDVKANVVQCAGNIFKNPVAYFTYMNSESWIIDSGAFSTCHIILSSFPVFTPYLFSCLSIFLIHSESKSLMEDLLLYHLM